MDRHDAAITGHPQVDDVRILEVRELVRPADLRVQVPITETVANFVCDVRATIGRILAGEDPRLLVVVGPCSVHDPAAALEYAKWLAEFRREFDDQLVIVMRVYFEKPRTRGGWKGLINDPCLDGTFRINEGLALARALLREINGLGVPAATEFVDPITPQYIGDLISWAAVGARTAESQVHRELVSGLSCPVGFKNNTAGDVGVAINAVVVARRPHHFLGVTRLGQAAIVSTTGNRDCHIILRGGAEPNYDEHAVRAAAARLAAEHLPPRLMVDCSHGNAGGRYERQLLVAQDVVQQRTNGHGGTICGLMVESNLIAGKQAIVSGRPLVPGLSVTDPCLGIDDTATLLRGLSACDMSLFASPRDRERASQVG